MTGRELVPDARMQRTIAVLDSLVDGEAAVAILIANGSSSIPYLEKYLLRKRPRTVPLPRCRAVHALGVLGARTTLLSYFREYQLPDDAQVRFAEDAVRSAAADELLRWKSSEVFDVLLEATKQRATSGLIFALGEFRRPECVPVLFEILGDGFCRVETIAALQKVPKAAHEFAILTLRNLTGVQLEGPSGLLRLRAILQLLQDFGVSPSEWQELRGYLASKDSEVTIAAAAIGLAVGSDADRRSAFNGLYRISRHINWAQEAQIESLVDSRHDEACELARLEVDSRFATGEQPAWLDPSWRILKHVLGNELNDVHDARVHPGTNHLHRQTRK